MSERTRTGAMLAAGAILASLGACQSAQDRYGGWKFEDDTFRSIDRLDLASAETAPPKAPDAAAIDQFIEQFKALAAGITAVAGGIVGVSLLVGGIGIMNIMLVAVSERTREIGLRKAVGATPVAILSQFLLEAVVLCILGGLIGLACGQALAFVISSIPNAGLEEASIPGWAVAMSFGFSGAVGVLFGMFPAIKASRLDPIEALRHE